MKQIEILQSQFTRIEHELKGVGVTKQLLWSEYKVQHPDGYNLTQFYHTIISGEKQAKQPCILIIKQVIKCL